MGEDNPPYRGQSRLSQRGRSRTEHIAVQWEADGANCQAEDKSFAGGPDHQAEDRPDRKSGMGQNFQVED